jgi:hypothetical protein
MRDQGEIQGLKELDERRTESTLNLTIISVVGSVGRYTTCTHLGVDGSQPPKNKRAFHHVRRHFWKRRSLKS